MNFILNTSLMKMIISKIIRKAVRNNLKINMEISVDELEIRSIEDSEYFNIRLKGNIKDKDLVEILRNNSIL